MQTSAKIILILILSFLVQILNFACVSFATQTYSAIDVSTPPPSGYPSYSQQNNGNHGYIVTSSAISCIVYIYLLIAKIVKKSCSKSIDYLCLLSVVCLQFGNAVTYFIFLRNNQVRFESARKTLSNLEAIVQQSAAGTQIPDITSYKNLFVMRSLVIFTVILTLVCIISGFFVIFKHSLQAKPQPKPQIEMNSRLQEDSKVDKQQASQQMDPK